MTEAAQDLYQMPLNIQNFQEQMPQVSLVLNNSTNGQNLIFDQNIVIQF